MRAESAWASVRECPLTVLIIAAVTVQRGTVWIMPSAWSVPEGRLCHPELSRFVVSWQDYLEDEQRSIQYDGDEIEGAENAIAWGRARCDLVRIRLAHTSESYFSAGETKDPAYPSWPPSQEPADGWWIATEADYDGPQLD
jgi:hypothetical protein